jgi:hypothetical protein
MKTDLNIRIDRKIVEEAEAYAKDRNTTVLNLIENFLTQLPSEKETEEITPLVKSLSGIITLPGNFNSKIGYAEYLSNKYESK